MKTRSGALLAAAYRRAPSLPHWASGTHSVVVCVAPSMHSSHSSLSGRKDAVPAYGRRWLRGCFQYTQNKMEAVSLRKNISFSPPPEDDIICGMEKFCVS